MRGPAHSSPGETPPETVVRAHMARVLDIWGPKLTSIERSNITEGAVEAMRRATSKRRETR